MSPKKDRKPVLHYQIPGLDLELIDIIQAKAKVATNAWEFFLWASCLQYLWRYDLKGESGKDLCKATTYLACLKKAVDYRGENVRADKD